VNLSNRSKLNSSQSPKRFASPKKKSSPVAFAPNTIQECEEPSQTPMTAVQGSSHENKSNQEPSNRMAVEYNRLELINHKRGSTMDRYTNRDLSS